MTRIERLQRAIAFYFSVALFFALLPILLSYSLGYQIDYKPFKIYKTGILYINSHPAGSYIFINGKRHTDLTPSQIEKLKPGSYNVEVGREGYYPWKQDLTVRPNMVTRADRIILFPRIQDMKMVSRRETYDFAVSDKNQIFYMTAHGLYRSDADGSNLKRIAPYSGWPKNIKGRKFYSNGTRFLFFTDRSIYVVYLNLDTKMTEDGEAAKVTEVLTLEEPIIDVFWYSSPSYIVVITEGGINVAELRGKEKQPNIVLLYKFNTSPPSVYYDDNNDSIYFTDTKRVVLDRNERYLYRLDLRQKFFDLVIKQLLRRETEAAYEKR